MSPLPLLPYAVIRVGGDELAPEVRALVTSLCVRDNLRLPDQAVLRLADPELRYVDQGPLKVGQSLDVKCATPGATSATSVFSGKIQSLELELVGDGTFVSATAYEPAYALHQNRRIQAFQNMTPGDIASKLIAGAGLTAAVESSGAASDPIPFLLQEEETDWQLLWRLACAIDFEVVGEGSNVHFRPAGSASGGSISLAAPEQLLSFRPRVSGAQQVTGVTVRGWDLSGAQAIVANGSPPTGDSSLGLTRSELASDAGVGAWAVAERAVVTQSEANALAGSMAAAIANSWLEADGVATGDPRLCAGCSVTISGVGSRFGGTYSVTSVTHTLIGGRGYTTSFKISGRSPATLLDLVDTGPRSASWASTVVVGVVTQNQDPDGLGRVRVRHPALGDDIEGWWARIASTAAGTSRGVLMMPVPGDEVVLAFEQGDPRRPYVLGAVWNGQAKPGDDLVKANGSFVLASDHDVSVTATEQATITGTKGLTMGGQKITAQADSDLQVKGATVTVQSDGSLTIKGASITVQAEGSLSLQSSGTVKVSGAQVMLG